MIHYHSQERDPPNGRLFCMYSTGPIFIGAIFYHLCHMTDFKYSPIYIYYVGCGSIADVVNLIVQHVNLTSVRPGILTSDYLSRTVRYSYEFGAI